MYLRFVRYIKLSETLKAVVLILAIVLIMNAAIEAGEYGGTVIQAKGTGMELAEKFMGVSLAVEKEMVFIVTKT